MPALPYVGLDEIKNDVKGTIKALVAEFLGTALLVLIACGSCMSGDQKDSDVQLSDQANIVRIALCFGITVATLAQTIGHVSGCHINPAVTAGLITGAKIGIVKGLLYIVAQSIGGVVGAGVLRAITPSSVRGYGNSEGGFGVTNPADGVNAGQAFAVEFIITMVLVLVVFAAAADANNAPSVKGSAPLAIGLSITTCHLYAIPLTGSSMNPARSLGPAIIAGNMKSLWVYWLGPIGGGVAAAIIYQLVFKAPEKKEPYTEVAMEEKA